MARTAVGTGEVRLKRRFKCTLSANHRFLVMQKTGLFKVELL